jgi:ADP-ribosylglycohydrolase
VPVPIDYLQRVYAGVLGKMIGVYLGRPFENWTYERIISELGEINYYVHEKLNKLLIVPDDDISGTFTFIKALNDHPNPRQVTSAQIGQAWLNYLIEGRTILWWGGKGNSTEHTAFLNLRNGIQAPLSGSAATNGKVVSEQIGAQIFIDGWAMVAPADPELAADLARRAASVSHDGEAVVAAQLLAAMEALAFVEPNLDKLLDAGLGLIPSSSTIFRLVNELREWRAREPDWVKARSFIAKKYGYEKYPGGCHVVPNHALVQLALLYGDDDFQKSLLIVNTSGWDTDCNSGNVGCLMGIKNGLENIDSGPDWRGPVADRLYLSCADGGAAITDAVTVACSLANIGLQLAGRPGIAPKNGARFHFELPGSVMGFQQYNLAEKSGVVKVENVAGHSLEGTRSLALRYSLACPGKGVQVATPVFLPPEMASPAGPYSLQACPTLYSGQQLNAAILAGADNQLPAVCSLVIFRYTDHGECELVRGPLVEVKPGNTRDLTWRVPGKQAGPIAAVGIEISGSLASHGTIYLDYLTWKGAPEIDLVRPSSGDLLWQRAWVDGIDQLWPRSSFPGPLKLVQNQGRGLLIQGTREWIDYQAETVLVPHLVSRLGLAVRVQGMRRYYALLLGSDQKARLVKVMDDEIILDEKDCRLEMFQPVSLRLQVAGNRLKAWVGQKLLFDCCDAGVALGGGGIGLVCEDGCFTCEIVSVLPAAMDTGPVVGLHAVENGVS